MIAPVKSYPLPSLAVERKQLWPFLKKSLDQLLEVYFYLALPLLSLLPIFGILSLQGEFVGKLLWIIVQSPALLGIWRVMQLQLNQNDIEISDYFYYFRKEQFKVYWPAFIIPHVLALAINALLGIFDGGFIANLISVTVSAALEILILLLQVRIVFFSSLKSPQEILNWFKSPDFYKTYWRALGVHDLRMVSFVLVVYYIGIVLVLFPFFFISLPLSFLLLYNHNELQKSAIAANSNPL